MLIKWIECTILPENREKFSNAQEQWKETALVNGFLGQTGGWNKEMEDGKLIAGIVAFWEDIEAYYSFMQNEHDKITEKNQQEQTYESVNVSLLDQILKINGIKDSFTFSDQNELMRIAICELNENRDVHFVNMQHEVWNPGMKSANMRFGFFTQDRSIGNKYQVLSFWRQSDHERYVQTTLPILREKAEVNTDIKSIKGRQVIIDQKWTIHPISSNY